MKLPRKPNALKRDSTLLPMTSTGSYLEAAKSAVARGHGVIAEKANHFVDQIRGRDALHIGGNNALNGADRIVEGMLIQTKYCASGAKCIESCFGPEGFRYMTSDGPMQVEVPRDMYASAVQAMRVRILRGQVPSASNPLRAEEIVRPGYLTYEQAVNLGRAGTIESLSYDLATGMVKTTFVLGLSASVRMAEGIWQGEEPREALQAALDASLSIGGKFLIVHIATNQIARSSFNATLQSIGSSVTHTMPAWLVQDICAGLGRGSLRGAAAQKYVSKAIGGNLAALLATNIMMLGVDAWDYGTGKQTATQMGRNILVRAGATSAGTTGSVLGMAQGAALGAAIPFLTPGIGAAIGGLAIGMAATNYGTQAVEAAIDYFTLSDEQKLDRIVHGAFAKEVDAHILNEDEAALLYHHLLDQNLENHHTGIVAAAHAEDFVRGLITPAAFAMLEKRHAVRA